MVAAVPQRLVDQYGQLTQQVPADVLADLTEAQLAGRLGRAEKRWNAALGSGGDGDLQAALRDVGEIMAAPAPGAKPKNGKSALKKAGITTKALLAHPGIGRIPDDVLAKMDAPTAEHRAVVAEQVARTHGAAAADRVLTAPADVVPTIQLTPDAAAAVRRGVREGLAIEHGRWIAEIPDSVLAKLDAAELTDRCEYAATLYKRGTQASQPGMIHGYLAQARRHLAALPRADVEAETVRLARAAMLSDDPRITEGLLEQARQVRAANPQVEGRPRPGLLGKACQAAPPARAEYVRLADGEILTKADIKALVLAELGHPGGFLGKAEAAETKLDSLTARVHRLVGEVAQVKVATKPV